MNERMRLTREEVVKKLEGRDAAAVLDRVLRSFSKPSNKPDGSAKTERQSNAKEN